MRRGRGKKGGDEESQTLKKLHGKLKQWRFRVMGVMEAEVEIFKALIEK